MASHSLLVLVAVLVPYSHGQFIHPVAHLDPAGLLGDWVYWLGEQTGTISRAEDGTYVFEFFNNTLMSMIQKGTSGQFSNGDGDEVMIYKFTPREEASIVFNGPTTDFQIVEVFYAGPDSGIPRVKGNL